MENGSVRAEKYGPAQPFSVIIIGAGISGLALATELCSRGVPLEKIVILEASDRIGGRVSLFELNSERSVRNALENTVNL